MATRLPTTPQLDGATLLGYLRGTVYLLTGVLAVSLLVVGTIGIIAELKGTWHWQIHLQTTVSYVGLFVSYLLGVLIPLFVVLLVGRVVVSDE